MRKGWRTIGRIAAIATATFAFGWWMTAFWQHQQDADAGVVWLKMTPKATALCAAFSDETIRGYNPQTGKEVFRFDGFPGQSTNPVSYGSSPLFFVQFTKRVRTLLQTLGNLPGLSSLQNQTVWLKRETAIVDPEAGRLLYRGSTSGDIEEIPVLGENPDRFILWNLNQGNGEQRMRVYDRTDSNKPLAAFDLPRPIGDPILDASGHWVCCWIQRGAKLLVFDSRTGKPHSICDKLPGNVSSSAWAMSNDGKFLIFGLRTGHIELWNIESETRAAVYGPLSEVPEWIAIADDSSMVTCVAQNGEVLVGRIDGGRLQMRAWLEGNPPVDMRILTAVNRLVILDRSNTVRWWDLNRPDSEPAGILPTLPGDLGPMELTNEGILVASRGAIASLIDVTGKTKNRTVTVGDGTQGRIKQIAVARNGILFAAASDFELEIRDLATGDSVARCWSATAQRREFYYWIGWSGPVVVFGLALFLFATWRMTAASANT